MKKRYFLSLLLIIILSGCSHKAEEMIEENNAYVEQATELPAELPDAPSDVIDIPIDNDSLLYVYLQSPQEFHSKYDIDELYRMGVSVSDISEVEFIRFSDNYSGEVIQSIKLGDSIESVKENLGEPQFFNNELMYIGYRTGDCYFAVEGTDLVESIVFTKSYKLPDGYDNMISDYLEFETDYLDQYSDYSFYGQLARGGDSIIYPFGVEFHRYAEDEIYVYTNFSGEIPESEYVVFIMEDSNEEKLRRYFETNRLFEKEVTAVSPDGIKEAFECTMINLYEQNKIYICSLDNSFAPRVFHPGYWIGDNMFWLDNDVLLYSGGPMLGAYSMKADKTYYISEEFDATDIEIILIDEVNNRVEGKADERLFILNYELADEFIFEIEWVENTPSELFALVINAYLELEQSYFKSYDEEILGDSLLAIDDGGTYNFGARGYPALKYAFYDMNSDGLVELIIGADNSIAGIYALQDGKPVYVLQAEIKYSIHLYEGIDGNVVIDYAWGHMGDAMELYYEIDTKGNLVSLDRLYTNGFETIDGVRSHFREKEMDGEQVSITEEEYCALIRQYGSSGYEIKEDDIEAREISLKWNKVADYNN